MKNEENINNIVSEVVIFGNEVSVDALRYALSLMAKQKDQQFEEYLEGRIAQDIKNQNDTLDAGDGDAAFFYSTRVQAYESIINKLFPESEHDNADREEAESMARKLRAVLNGADVIEMPSEEELKEIPTKKVEGDAYIDAYFMGVMDILDWIKYRKQMKEGISRPRIENEVSVVDWIKSKSKIVK